MCFWKRDRSALALQNCKGNLIIFSVSPPTKNKLREFSPGTDESRMSSWHSNKLVVCNGGMPKTRINHPNAGNLPCRNKVLKNLSHISIPLLMNDSGLKFEITPLDTNFSCCEIRLYIEIVNLMSYKPEQCLLGWVVEFKESVT